MAALLGTAVTAALALHGTVCRPPQAPLVVRMMASSDDSLDMSILARRVAEVQSAEAVRFSNRKRKERRQR